jgi:DNA-binding HxlR family transcriptional regulator
MKRKHLTVAERTTYRSLEDVVGCKWSASVVAALERGVRRPGELERFIPGISAKILHERLRRLAEYGLIERTEPATTSAVAHVEYVLTSTGRRLASVIGQLRELQIEHDASGTVTPP